MPGARRSGVAAGPGRGAAGSLGAWVELVRTATCFSLIDTFLCPLSVTSRSRICSFNQLSMYISLFISLLGKILI